MGLVINTNQSALMIQHNLSKATQELNTYMERLSTGLRINSAADDAAGLALSEDLRAQIKSSDVAKNNVQTGVNMMQIAESDLGTIHENLQRMRDLAVQSANGVYSGSERTALNNEYAQRVAEITRITNSSEFSGLKLLTGAIGATLNIQAGTNNSADDRINIAANSVFGNVLTAITSDSGNISTVGAAQTAIGNLDNDIEAISTRRSNIGAMTNRLEGTLERIDVRKENMSASFSIIRDADIATEAAALTRVQIIQQSAASLLQQANQAPGLALSLL